ncbi:hypothetical protein MCEMSHM24_02736 [Comamonadaceae bacterium]
MSELRSGKRAQAWDQLDLLTPDGSPPHGVGGRQACEAAQGGGGGYLNGCTPPKAALRGSKKIANFFASPTTEPREAALLAELDAMGLSRVMLQVAHAIGFDNFMAMWQILDGSYEALADNDSGIYIRLQRLSAYKRYQRNRFIEAMVRMGMTQPEISRAVKRDLGEEVSDRHIFRLMAGGRVKA